MKHRKENFVIDNKECIGYITDVAKYLMIQPVDGHDIEVLDNEVAEIQKNTEKLFSLMNFLLGKQLQHLEIKLSVQVLKIL